MLSGLVKFDQTELRPTIGDFIKIFYFQRTIPDKCKKAIEVIKVESTDKVNNNLVREIQGLLEIKFHNQSDYSKPDFAFIKTDSIDYYVHKSILEKYQIHYDCYVKAKVIYADKGEWKVFKISSIKVKID